MRTTALTSLLVIGALVVPAAAPAQADRKQIVQSPSAGPVAAPRSALTGELRLTGTTRARKDPFLSPAEVAAEVRPYAPEIERCYLERLDDTRRAGHLDLTFVIGRDGYVVSLVAAAQGLSSRTTHQIESCIREAVTAIHFPARRSDTTAIVPYYFQHTDAPGAGPQLSCWNPRGCKT
jgi:hypothetical protein